VEAGTPVFVDIQSVAAVSDPDLEPFCHAAEVLAMSSANIPCSPVEWLRQMGDRYAPPVMVLGLADRGALLARDAGKRIDHVAAAPAQVRSTVGAGDALWACFIDGYLRSGDALWALERAVVAAAHKVATIGGAEGLITASELQSMGWAAPS
jgi:ribokinase